MKDVILSEIKVNTKSPTEKQQKQGADILKQADYFRSLGYDKSADELIDIYNQKGYNAAVNWIVDRVNKLNEENSVNSMIQNIHKGTGEVAKSGFGLATAIPGVDAFSDIGYTVVDAIKGNWGNVGLGLGLALIPGLGYGAYKLTKKAPVSKYNKIRVSRDKLLNSRNSRIAQIVNDASYNVDDFELIKERLRNGGYDKLGISENDWIIVPSNTYPDLGEPFKEGLRKVNAREFLDNIKMHRWGVEDFEYSLDEKSIFLPKTFDGYWLDPKTENIIKTHEFGHAIDDVIISKNKPYLTNLKEHTVAIDIPGVDFNNELEIKPYFTLGEGTELKQRYSQLLNYFNKKNSTLSLAEWNFAKKHYGFDNNMKEFFNVVTNPKKFIKYMSKVVPIGIGTVVGVNKFIEHE